MPLGEKALNPETPYFIYEYSVSGRVFYVGITWSEVRAYKRWSHVRNLCDHEDRRTLKPDKAKDLGRKSNQVIAAIFRAGLSEHEVRTTWRGVGKAAAEKAERGRIKELATAGARLANEDHNPRRSTVEEILEYLGIRRAT